MDFELCNFELLIPVLFLTMYSSDLVPQGDKMPNTYLVNDWVEEDVGIHFLHLLLDPPVGGEVRDVSLFGCTSTCNEQPNNPALPVNHYGTRVAESRKGAVLVAVRIDSNLDGRLPDGVLGVGANK